MNLAAAKESLYESFSKVCKFFGNIWYWFRCHTFTRYHILDLRGPEGYQWGYIDRDRLLLYANFKILCDFVEKEDPFNIIDWEWNEEKRNAKSEIEALYRWWKVERDQLRAERDSCLSRAFEDPVISSGPRSEETGLPTVVFHIKDQGALDRTHELDRVVEDKDQEMLIRLVKIRPHLWT